ncbi:MAG: polysialyltransferase family glycosyltransferase [Salinivirgaceae bacterium]
MKHVLFLINTEFVLMTSVIYYYEHLKPKGASPIFILLTSNAARFKSVDTTCLPGECHIYKNDLNHSVIFPDREFLKALNYSNVSELIIQNFTFLVNDIAINYYKQKGAKITFIADSISVDRKLSASAKAKNRFYLALRKRFNGFKYLSKQIYSFTDHGNRIDRYIAHRKVWENIPYFDIKTLFTKEYNLLPLFGGNLQTNLDAFDVYLFTQPILEHRAFTDKTKELYIQIIEKIIAVSQEKNIRLLIKVHPGEELTKYQKYKCKTVEVMQNNSIPAEIILNSVKHKKIFSFFSSISLFDYSGANEHFWLFKLIDYTPPGKNSYIGITNIESFKQLIQIF